jgi:dUTP pyrophosphatase
MPTSRGASEIFGEKRGLIMVQVKVKKLHEDAVIPVKAHPTDAGFDLYAVEEIQLNAWQTELVPTGLAFELPLGYEMQVRPRSGISLKTPLKVILGTVDAGYRGEVGIIVNNVSPYLHTIKKGEKIAQAVIQKLPEIELVEVDELDNGDRGENGFGSTGV